MKKIWLTSAVAGLSSIPAWTPTLVAQDDAAPAKPTVAVVVTEGSETGGEGHQQVHVVQVAAGEAAKAIADVEKELAKSKLDAETRKKILDSVRSALDEKTGKSNGAKIEKKVMQFKVHQDEDGKGGKTIRVEGVPAHVESKQVVVTQGEPISVDGEAIVVGKDGKEKRIQLRQFVPGVSAGDKVTVTAIAGDEDHVHKTLKALRDSGVDEATIDKVEKALKQAMPKVADAVRAASAATESRYVIGIALNHSHEEEDGEESDELMIGSVFDGSPASEAGVKVGDELIKVNDKSVSSVEDLIEAVQEAGKAGKKVKLQLERDGKEMTIEIAPKLSSAITALQNLPADVKAQLEKMPGGAMNAFLLPETASIDLIAPRVMGRLMAPGNSEEIESLRDEIKDLKKDIKDLKEMLKGLKDSSK